MSKHIVIDARQYSTSSGRYVRELINGLEKLDKENGYTILLSPQNLEAYTPSNSNFNKLAAPFIQFSFSEQIDFIGFINKLKPDLVHFTFAQQPMFYFKNKVTTIHDLTALKFTSSGISKLIYLYMRFFYKLLVKSVVRRSKVILTPSQFTKEDLLSLTKQKYSDKIVVTYEAATQNTDESTKINDLENKEFIMYTGRPAPHKNLPKLVEAFKILSKSRPNLKLVLVGKKEDKYLKIEKYIDKKNIPNVIFTDFVSDQELNWLYVHTSAYVFPSLSEGFGLPGLEAMVHGAPVVSSNATCLPEIYGDAALYFNPLDAEDMALKIERVLSDKNYRKQLIAHGHKQVAKYSWEKTAEQTLEVYKSILNK